MYFILFCLFANTKAQRSRVVDVSSNYSTEQEVGKR